MARFADWEAGKGDCGPADIELAAVTGKLASGDWVNGLAQTFAYCQRTGP